MGWCDVRCGHDGYLLCLENIPDLHTLTATSVHSPEALSLPRHEPHHAWCDEAIFWARKSSFDPSTRTKWVWSVRRPLPHPACEVGLSTIVQNIIHNSFGHHLFHADKVTFMPKVIVPTCHSATLVSQGHTWISRSKVFRSGISWVEIREIVDALPTMDKTRDPWWTALGVVTPHFAWASDFNYRPECLQLKSRRTWYPVVSLRGVRPDT